MTWAPEFQAGGSSCCSGGSLPDGESGRPADHGRRSGGGNSALLHYHPPLPYTPSSSSTARRHHFFHEPRTCRLRKNIISIAYGVMLGLFVWLCLYTLSFSCCVVGNVAHIDDDDSSLSSASEYVGRGGYGGGGTHIPNTRTVAREVTLTRSGPKPLQGGAGSRKLEEDDMIYTLPEDPEELPLLDERGGEEQYHSRDVPLSSSSGHSNKHHHSLLTLGESNSLHPRNYPRSSRDYNHRDPQNNNNYNTDNSQTGDSDTEEDNDANAGDISDIRNNKFDTSKPPRRRSKDKYKIDSTTRTKPGYTRKLPSSLIIGVKKGGTRALLEFLRIHPDIRAPGPEPHFFDRNYERGLDWYRRQMPPTLDSQLTIEKSPSYFVTKGVPGRIYNMSRETKLLVVVRDPVTRAISDYTQSASKRTDLKPFEQMAFLDNNTGLVDTSWGAIRIGVYAKHLERWLRYFPLSQIHFVSGEKLISDPAKELEKVQDFLGLKRVITDKHFYFNSTKGFPCLKKPEGSGSPHCLGKTKGRPHPKVHPKVIKRLHDFFRPFNAKFYQMTGLDFGWP